MTIEYYLYLVGYFLYLISNYSVLVRYSYLNARLYFRYISLFAMYARLVVRLLQAILVRHQDGGGPSRDDAGGRSSRCVNGYGLLYRIPSLEAF